METNRFVHLHVHTEYSLLDGVARIKKLIEKAASMGMKSIAITDHGNMHGVVQFYKEAKKYNINPIIGCEVYIASRTMADKDPVRDKNQYHLVLLAENQKGYNNLIKIVSKGYVEGFYYKPRVDIAVLKEHSEGLIVLSACLAGEIQTFLMEGNQEKAIEKALEYKQIFGKNNFYLELQNHGMPEQIKVNQYLQEISKQYHIPLVMTNDVHYINKEDSKFHEVLLCIQTGKTMNDQDRMRFPTDAFYLKSYEEMMKEFPGMEEAAKNTVKISERCHVELDFDTVHLPSFVSPDGYKNEKYLEKLCYEGLKERYPKLNDKIFQRIEYELEVIRSMGYVDYFLIVWDFIKYAKDNKIMVGPGRGSAVGSLVAYALKITDIDPLKFNLIFERFLNPERISMPDIDIDFCYERREEVIDYVVQKYGSDKVAQIVTFGTMAARGAIRDVGRAMNIPYSDVDLIAKKIPTELGITIKSALEKSKELQELYDRDDDVKELIDIARKVEGLPRHTSTHAAGVVISKLPITDYVPLSRSKDVIVTQFNMIELEELGLLKMDFLGLRTLTVIRDAIDLVQKNRNTEVSFENCEYDDPNIYELFSKGETLGIFQFESSGMRAILKEMKPDHFENIVAANALYRPGPMQQIPTYIKNKNDKNHIAYIHPKLKDILEITYGCMVYQEQVMQIVRDIGGFSLGRSDLVRRAMSKKKMKEMERERQYFIYGKLDDEGKVEISGAIANGVSEKEANKIYDLMIDFANYAFNKSHSAAYSALAYHTAWLKTYYPVEFMAAQISSMMNSAGSVSTYIRECKRLGIEVLPPDINESESKFIVKDNSIRFGLAAVKNVGSGAIDNIVAARKKDGRFKTFSDFCNKVDTMVLNKRQIESLIKGGAFDSLHVKRSQLMAIYENTIDSVQREKKNRLKGQVSLFDHQAFDSDFENEFLPELREFEDRIKLLMEKEMLGIYVSGHPLSEFEEIINRTVTLNYSQIEEYLNEPTVRNPLIYDGSKVVVGGMIVAKQNKITRNNNLMCFMTIEDFYGEIEIIIFPQIYEKYREIIEIDNMVIIHGKLSFSEEEAPKMISEKISLLNKELNSVLYLKIGNHHNIEGIKKEILEIAEKYQGVNEVFVYLENNKKVYKLPARYNVDITNQLMLVEFKERLGDENVVLKDKLNG
ncbi:MAG: DNA polymerase III subunit alpha [Tissierellales bacterium]|nr:DNA polymerase III subunit alpha [Tissierellales bacterium]MBN2826943.1 DNA polymerase III subunit alpha [Tissierellales bacterium]